jgi:hypothetical protein
MIDADIITSLRSRGYPSSPSLTDAEITEAIASARRDLKKKLPLLTYGTFTTRADQQVYDLFSSTVVAATQQGALPGGLQVIEMLWCSGGLLSDNLFGIAPYLQNLSLFGAGEITENSFHTPGDWIIFDSNWAALTKRFGTLRWEQVASNPGAPVRLFPVPCEETTVFVRYTKARSDSEMQALDESTFLKFVEGEVCDTLANKLTSTAGTTVGRLRDEGKRAAIWTAKAIRLKEQAEKMLCDSDLIILSSAARS